MVSHGTTTGAPTESAPGARGAVPVPVSIRPAVGGAPSAALAAALRGFGRAAEPLWVAGLAVLCLLVGWVVFSSPWVNLQGKTYDWAQYAVVGIVFPALLFGVPLLWRWRGWPTAPSRPLRRALALGGVAAVAALVAASAAKYGPASGLLPVALAVAQTAVMTRAWRRDGYDASRVAVAFVVALAAWTAANSLYLSALVAPPTFLAGFAVAFGLVCAATRDPDAAERPVAVRPWSPANLVALALIAAMSLRTEGLFEVLGERGALHHWGAWVGAADLLREGGWLLWDAPSNYGHLNVLLFNALPTATPWQGFYLAQAAAFFVVSGGIFLVLRAMRSGWLNWLFALAVGIAIPMYSAMLNAAGEVTSTFVFPNWGPYRYVMSFVLVLILIWEYATDERSPRHAWVLVAGNLAWLVGVLWSTESAFFSSGAWLPAYAVIVLRRAATSEAPRRWPRAAAWLALPAVLLAATVGVIAAIYAIGLGHLPDWSATLDYVLEVGLNVLVVVTEPVGPALGMLIGFVALAVGAWYAGTRAGLPGRSFGLWIGLLGAFVATNAYGYQRGAVTLHPVAYAALGALLVLVFRLAGGSTWGGVARAAVAPLLVLALAAPFASAIRQPWGAQQALASLASTARNGFRVEQYLPDADPELQALMAEAGIKPSDPVFYAADWLGNLLLPWRPDGATEGERVLSNPHWIPGHPSLALRWIPPGRGAVYVERYLDRAPRSGWMIQGKTGQGASADFPAFAPGSDQWLFDLLRRGHVPTRIYESANWQAVWWEYVGDRPDIARPDFHVGRLGPLPPDVAVDGVPLNETAQPEVWTVFGTGWGTLDPENGRAFGDRARLWVYSPDAREVLLRLTADPISPGTRLTVDGAVADAEADARPLRLEGGGTARTRLALAPGWNAVDLAQLREDAAPPAGADGGAPADAAAPAAMPAATATPTRYVLIDQIELVTREGRE